jgi:hypothetical protein
MKPDSRCFYLGLVGLLLVPSPPSLATDVVTVLKMRSYLQSEDGPAEVVREVPPEQVHQMSPPFGFLTDTQLDGDGQLNELWWEHPDGKRLELPTAGVLQVIDGFATVGALEAAYPSGTYGLRAIQKNGSESQSALRWSGVDYPPAPRLRNIRALSRSEGVQEYVLAWDPFVGGTTNDIIVLTDGFASSDYLHGELTPPPGHARALDGTATSVLLRDDFIASTNQFRLVFIKVTDRQTNAAGDWVGIAGVASETLAGFSAVREEVPILPDTNAPVLVSSSPEPGDTNVWTTTDISFEFDRPMLDVVSIGWSTNIQTARMSCNWSGQPAPTYLYCSYAEPLPSDAVVTWVLNPAGAMGPVMAGTNGVALPANRYSGSFRTMKTGSTNLVGVGVSVSRTFRQSDALTTLEEEDTDGFMGPPGVYALFDGEVAKPLGATVTLPDGTILDEFPDWGVDYHLIELPEGTLEDWEDLVGAAPIVFDLRPGVGAPLKATLQLNMDVEGPSPRILNFEEAQAVDPEREFILKWEVEGAAPDFFYQSFDMSRSRIGPGDPSEWMPVEWRYRFEDPSSGGPVEWPQWSGFIEPGATDRTWAIPAGSLVPGALYEVRLTTFRYSDLQVSGPAGTWGALDYGHTLLFTLRTKGDPAAERRMEFVGTPLLAATPGAAMDLSLSASGGTAPYRWSLVAGSELPAGVTLTTDGRLTGTPTTDGVFHFGVRVVDTPSRVLEEHPERTAARSYRLQVGSGGVIPESQPVLMLDRSAEAGVVAFGFSSRSGSNYRVEFSTDLRGWSLLRRVSGTGSNVVVREPVASGEPGRYFRVVVE